MGGSRELLLPGGDITVTPQHIWPSVTASVFILNLKQTCKLSFAAATFKKNVLNDQSLATPLIPPLEETTFLVVVIHLLGGAIKCCECEVLLKCLRENI